MGGIVRNAYGKGIVAISAPLGSQMNHYAEVSAARHTIKLSRDMGIRNLWLKGDSKNIIYCLNEKNKPTWTIESIIGDCI